MIRELQSDSITGEMIHIDFQRVKMDQAVKVFVAIEIQGVAEGVKTDGGLLDIPTRERFLETLQKLARKTQMIYVTHHIEEILPAITHILYLKDGTIFRQGNKDSMLQDKILSQALGHPLTLHKNNGRYWAGPRPEEK